MASLYVPSRIGSPTGNGYKLYFYETGTTTPLDTYSQSDLAAGHENLNPVVADANGLFGPIYLKPTPDYKAVLTNSAGTTIWTADPLLTAAVSVITTEGDLIVGNSSNVAARLPIGAGGKYLRSDGTTAAWSDLDLADATGDIPVTSLPAGSIVQEVFASTNAYSTAATVMPIDDTIPTNAEGNQILTATINPTNTTNKVRITALAQVASGTTVALALFQNATAAAIATAAEFNGGTGVYQIDLIFEHVPGSVSAQTYNLRVGTDPGPVFVNGDSSSRLYGGTMISFMRLEEIVV